MMRSSVVIAKVLVAMSAVAALAGCGQKGPLTLPATAPSASAASR